jgi:hypothetical protein
MDHSTAHLIDISANTNDVIKSEFTFKTKEEALTRSEKLMHNKRQQMQEAYYKKMGDEILKFNNILLFGLTKAKVELHNFLLKDLHFKDTTFSIEAVDSMTDNEEVAFVKNHFKQK